LNFSLDNIEGVGAFIHSISRELKPTKRICLFCSKNLVTKKQQKRLKSAC